MLWGKKGSSGHLDYILLIDVLEGVSHAPETELGNKERHGGVEENACLERPRQQPMQTCGGRVQQQKSSKSAPSHGQALLWFPEKDKLTACLHGTERQVPWQLTRLVFLSMITVSHDNRVFSPQGHYAWLPRDGLLWETEFSQKLDLSPTDGKGSGSYGVQSIYNVNPFFHLWKKQQWKPHCTQKK